MVYIKHWLIYDTWFYFMARIMPKAVVSQGRDWQGGLGVLPQENFGESSAKIVQF